MNPTFRYTTQFTLDKTYYSECFDQSVNQDFSIKHYIKACIFIVAGTALLLTGVNNYASWFIIGLGLLEALSIKFKRPWWLMRQMWSRAAGNKVNLTLDEDGIATQSDHLESLLPWEDICRFKETEQGFLLQLRRGQYYLSKRYLDHPAEEFIRTKVSQRENQTS